MSGSECRWTDKQEKALFVCVTRYGRDWMKISNILGVSHFLAEFYWSNVMDPRVKQSFIKAEEKYKNNLLPKCLPKSPREPNDDCANKTDVKHDFVKSRIPVLKKSDVQDKSSPRPHSKADVIETCGIRNVRNAEGKVIARKLFVREDTKLERTIRGKIATNDVVLNGNVQSYTPKRSVKTDNHNNNTVKMVKM